MVEGLDEALAAETLGENAAQIKFYCLPIWSLEPSKPEFPISECLDPSDARSSTRAMVVSLTNAVNHPIKLTKPCGGVVNWRSMVGKNESFVGK